MADEKITKKKKPDFVVKESKFSARVKSRWRYPRGMHSKVRQRHKGRPALPSTGYGAARETRGKHESGLEIVMVHNAAGLDLLNKESQGALISGTVGNKKKLVLLQSAKDKGITIINVKNIEFIPKIREHILILSYLFKLRHSIMFRLVSQLQKRSIFWKTCLNIL